MSTLREEFNLDADAQLLITAIRAIRAWRYRPTRQALTSVAYQGTRWTPDWNTADCAEKKGGDPYWSNVPPHRVGDTLQHPSGRPHKHQCGFYGYWKGSVNTFAKDYREAHLVEGVIELAGMVSTHSRGVRGERARIVALVPHPQHGPDVADHLAGLYGVPLYPTLADALADYPLEEGL